LQATVAFSLGWSSGDGDGGFVLGLEVEELALPPAAQMDFVSMWGSC